MNAAALAVLLALPASAEHPPFRVAVIEDVPTIMTAVLSQPLERLLRDTTGNELIGAENVACEFGGWNFAFRLPASLGVPEAPKKAGAVALESDSEIAFVYPPLPSLVDALVEAAADPRSYRRLGSLRLERRGATVARTFLPTGDVRFLIRAPLERSPTLRRRSSIAVYYRLRWEGRDAAVIVLGRPFGGLGRLGAVAAREAARGPLVGVARGEAFGRRARSDAPGRAALDALERAGLRVSAVDATMAALWAELDAYRRERPGGVRFLSANILAEQGPALPAYEIVSSSGLRVAFVGLTAASAEPALREARGKGWSVKDPVAAAEELVPELREKADVVVALGRLDAAELARLQGVRGLDLILGEDESALTTGPAPRGELFQEDRPAYAAPFPPLRLHVPTLELVSIERVPDEGRFDWRVEQRGVTLDDSINPAEGYPIASLDEFAARASTGAALLPPARAVFPRALRPRGVPVYEPRDIWTLAAGAVVERARAEAAILPVGPLAVQTLGDVREPYLRQWLGQDGRVSLISIPGATLVTLAEDAAAQAAREAAGQTVPEPRYVVAGVQGARVRGAPLDRSTRYRVAVADRLVERLGLDGPGEPLPPAAHPGEATLAELRRVAGSPPESYRSWMGGASFVEPGLWRVNFRDIGLNLRQTRVSRSEAFDAVPNSRVQGFDELLVGGVLKTDVDYLRGDYKWTNTLQAEYAKSRLEPRGAPPTTNLAANRIMFLTLGTRRVGGITHAWLARSWGPSLGLQYDGEFEAAPGLRRRNVYSAFPGVEFYDGSVVKSLSTSGIVKRDLSRDPPNTQTGLRLRALFSASVGRGAGATVQGELWSNYFFLTRRDQPSDLRVEGDANVKLVVPLYKHLSVAPFLSFYWFQLKTRPDWGHSLMMGLTVGFSRLWKPQYERF